MCVGEDAAGAGEPDSRPGSSTVWLGSLMPAVRHLVGCGRCKALRNENYSIKKGSRSFQWPLRSGRDHRSEFVRKRSARRTHRQRRISRYSLRAPARHTRVGSCHHVMRGGHIDRSSQDAPSSTGLIVYVCQLRPANSYVMLRNVRGKWERIIPIFGPSALYDRRFSAPPSSS